MEKALTKLNTQVITKELVTAMVVSVGYFGLCVINPFQAFTALTSLSLLSNVRIADVLRAKTISSLGAGLGVALGAHAYNIYRGKVALGAYPIMPIIIFGIWASAYFALERMGRSFKKELTVILIAGLATGFVVSMHLTSLAILFSGTAWSKLLTIGALWKMINHALVPAIAYLTYKGIKK